MTLSLPCSRWGTQEPVSLHPDIIGSQPPTHGAEQRGFCAACYSNHSALTPATAREGEAASGFGGVPPWGAIPNAVDRVVCGGREGRAQARCGTRAPGRAVFVRDFGFHGNKAANKMRNYNDHGPGRAAARTRRTDR